MLISRVKAVSSDRVTAAATLYLQKVSSFRELLELYEIGKRSDEGSVAAAARMVGLQVVDNRLK